MTYLTPFVIHQLGYWSETAKQLLVVDYQRYLSQQNFTLTDKVAWFQAQLAQRQAATEDEAQQQQLVLIGEQLAEQSELLTDLNWQVQMIRQEEGEG